MQNIYFGPLEGLFFHGFGGGKADGVVGVMKGMVYFHCHSGLNPVVTYHLITSARKRTPLLHLMQNAFKKNFKWLLKMSSFCMCL